MWIAIFWTFVFLIVEIEDWKGHTDYKKKRDVETEFKEQPNLHMNHEIVFRSMMEGAPTAIKLALLWNNAFMISSDNCFMCSSRLYLVAQNAAYIHAIFFNSLHEH